MWKVLLAPCSARRARRAFGSRSLSTAILAQDEEALYSRGEPGGRNQLFGPIEVKLLPGKGRGFVAKGPIELGDLLAWVPPAAVLHGPVDDTPDAALLMPQLMALRVDAVPWAARAALQHLDDGAGTASSTLPPPFWDPAAIGLAATSAAAPAAAAAAQKPWPPPEAELARLVKANAFSDDYEDLAAAAARGAGGKSVAGLWPGFSYFNHSCLPSTVHYAVGSGMVVRAVQDISAGDEVTISYLGREEFAPAAARRAVLRERWGFSCDCERCRVEAAAPAALTRAVEETYARVMQDLRPAFLEAAAAGDGAALSAASTQLRAADAVARAAIREHAPSGDPGIHPATATFAHAALYELHELTYAATQLESVGGGSSGSEQGHAALAALSRCLSIVDTVSRGAELHVFLAAALYETASELRGKDSAAAAAALQLLGQASEARYGKQLGATLWDALQSANCELAPEYL